MHNLSSSDDFEPTRALIIPSDPDLPARTVVLRDDLQIARIVGEGIPSTSRVGYNARVWAAGDSRSELNERATEYGSRALYGDVVITGDSVGELRDEPEDVIERFRDEQDREREEARSAMEDRSYEIERDDGYAIA